LRLSDAIITSKNAGKIPIIAEIKLKTPRDGDLLKGRRPVNLAREMESAGATALSIVTESSYFGGNNQILRNVSKSVKIPILRKDFIRTEGQIYDSKSSGASALLLISSIMSFDVISRLCRLTRDIGLESLVEVHSSREMREILNLDPRMISINNRNILQLEMDSGDVSTTEKLVKLVPKQVLLISASSIKTREDVLRALDAGADAVLIGTTLMKAPSIRKKMQELMDI
jgi:indole-3-glycerol phosphate synthase